MMHRISHWLTRHAAALFFPAALILYVIFQPILLPT